MTKPKKRARAATSAKARHETARPPALKAELVLPSCVMLSTGCANPAQVRLNGLAVCEICVHTLLRHTARAKLEPIEGAEKAQDVMRYFIERAR